MCATPLATQLDLSAATLDPCLALPAGRPGWTGRRPTRRQVREVTARTISMGGHQPSRSHGHCFSRSSPDFLILTTGQHQASRQRGFRSFDRRQDRCDRSRRQYSRNGSPLARRAPAPTHPAIVVVSPNDDDWLAALLAGLRDVGVAFAGGSGWPPTARFGQLRIAGKVAGPSLKVVWRSARQSGLIPHELGARRRFVAVDRSTGRHNFE